MGFLFLRLIKLTGQCASRPVANQPVLEILPLAGLNAAVNSIAQSHQRHGAEDTGNWDAKQTNYNGAKHACDRPCNSGNDPAANPPDQLKDQRLLGLIGNIP